MSSGSRKDRTVPEIKRCQMMAIKRRGAGILKGEGRNAKSEGWMARSPKWRIKGANSNWGGNEKGIKIILNAGNWKKKIGGV